MLEKGEGSLSSVVLPAWLSCQLRIQGVENKESSSPLDVLGLPSQRAARTIAGGAMVI